MFNKFRLLKIIDNSVLTVTGERHLYLQKILDYFRLSYVSSIRIKVFEYYQYQTLPLTACDNQELYL